MFNCLFVHSRGLVVNDVLIMRLGVADDRQNFIDTHSYALIPSEVGYPLNSRLVGVASRNVDVLMWSRPMGCGGTE